MLLKENIQRLQGEYCPNFDRFLYFIEISSSSKKKKKKKKQKKKKKKKKKKGVTEKNMFVGNVLFVLNVHELSPPVTLLLTLNRNMWPLAICDHWQLIFEK